MLVCRYLEKIRIRGQTSTTSLSLESLIGRRVETSFAITKNPRGECQVLNLSNGVTHREVAANLAKNGFQWVADNVDKCVWISTTTGPERWRRGRNYEWPIISLVRDAWLYRAMCSFLTH